MHFHRYPIYVGNIVYNLDKDIYLVRLEGITHIVINNYIINNYTNLKLLAKNIIDKYLISDSAVGVMFINNIFNKVIKIYPVVWVRDIDTIFFETACGSGTASVSILKSFITKSSIELDVIQPSNEIIKAKVKYINGIKEVVICGGVKTDGIIRSI
jgi:histidine racemase